MKNKFCAVLFAVAVFFFIITFSIGLPIYFRPFYYAHIDALDLTYVSGFTKAEIKEAYNEVLDYLTLPGKEFSAGVMGYSESGASHFEECKVLFDLNASVLVISAAVIVVLLVLCKKGIIERPVICYVSAEFWSAVAAIILPVILGVFVAIDFHKTFYVFHKIFFPNNYDWIFDPETDPIINVLPSGFFMNCAILIACGVFIISLALIVKETVSYKKSKKNAV